MMMTSMISTSDLFEDITKTCPCNIQRIFSAVKIEKFIGKILILLPKTYIVGTCWNRLTEAVLMSTHNICFGSKVRKLGIPLHTPVFLYRCGVEGGIHFTDMFS